MSMKKKNRCLEDKYAVQNSQPSATTPRKNRVPHSKEGSRQGSVAQESNPQCDSNNPFIIEDIDVHPDIEDAADRLRPLSISPVDKKRTTDTQRAQSRHLSATPSKSKIMTLKSPSKRSPLKPPVLGVAPSLSVDNPTAGNSRGLLQNNLTEILRLAKQENNKSSNISRRPPRKLQGRANSATESGLLGNDSNSLSRSNSMKSNFSVAAGGESVTDDSNNRNDSLSRTNSNTFSNNLDFGESMVYDSHREPSVGRGTHGVVNSQAEAPPSQAIHYLDTDAEAERKKLFEKLAMIDERVDMKGRKMVQSTVSAQELGGPVPRKTRRAAAG
ncbi:hypothetical protein AA313_de0208723 [Arthrobotrys entomopaga]|nr:hypothetical protein AA313_de0208723 [Arthrobotrys entomopaga]